MSYFTSVLQKPWLVAVGAVEDFRTQIVVGFMPNSAAAPGTVVWPPGTPYDGFLTAPQTISVSSDSGDDTIAGTGAQKVRVEGLDSNWDHIVQEVDLAGVALVPLPTDLIRVNLSAVIQSGTGKVNAGNIAVEAAGGEVMHYIAAGEGWGRTAVYTVPGGYRGVLVGASFSAYGKQVTGRLHAYTFPGNTEFDIISTVVEDGSAGGDWSAVPGGFNEKAGISIWAETVTPGPATVFGVFEVMVIKADPSWPWPSEVR